MKYYVFSLMLIFACLSITSWGQDNSIFVTFERDDLSIPDKKDLTMNSGSQIDFNRVANISNFKTPSTITTFAIYSRSANYAQQYFLSMFPFGWSKTGFERAKANVYPDLPMDTIDIQKIYIYVGMDKEKGEKYVIIDNNNNKNFTDDKAHSYPLDRYNEDISLFEIIDVSIPYYTGSGYVSINGRIGLYPHINPEATYPYSEPSLNIGITNCRNHLLGQLVLDNKNIRIMVSGADHMITTRLTNKDTFDIIPDITQNTIQYCKLGDTLQLGERRVVLKSAEGTRLEMVDLGSLPDSSSVGRYLPALYAYDVDDSHTVLVNDMIKGKYAFIDLWGSWCGPCIKSLPKMVEMYGKVRGRDDVALIGLGAERDQEGVAALKQAISDNNVLWPNYWFHRTAEKFQGTPAEKLKIAGYPSYIIVDKSGKIVFTTNDPSCKREDAISFFMDLIK